MHVYLRGNVQQRLRLASGLVLFAFAATHFFNHALGLVSLESMHLAQELRTAVTRSVPGTMILFMSLATHVTLGLYKLAKRKTLRMPRWEAVQIGLGLAIPFLLFPHIINTRIAHTFFGVNDSYLYELKRLWPDNAPLQSLLLLMVWGHGCMGLHYWLQLSDGYKRFAPALLVVAIAVPLMALAGFAVAGRVTGEIMSDPEALAALKKRSNWPNEANGTTLGAWRDGVRLLYATLLGIIAAIVYGRHHRRNSTPQAFPRITYVGGPAITINPGKTLLEASRSAGLPHASLCGGRARCTTCRVRIEVGLDSLPAPSGSEAITLRSIEAPPNVRLACQIRPTSSLTVAIISPPATPAPPQPDFIEIKEVVAAHVRAILAGQLVDVASTDPGEIVRWAKSKVTYPLVIPEIEFQGFVLMGGRLDYLLDRPALALVYMCHERPITAFVLPTDGASALAIRGTRNGYHVLAWSDANRAFFTVSDLEPVELDKFETMMSAKETTL